MILFHNKLKQLYNYQINEKRKPTEAKRLLPIVENAHSLAERFHLPMYTNKCFPTHINGHYVAYKIKKIQNL